MNRPNSISAAAAVGLFFATAMPIGASPTDARLSATGQGQVLARPTKAVMVCGVSGEATLISDAITKYRDARRRAMESLDALEIAGLSIQEGGMRLSYVLDPQQINLLVSGRLSEPLDPTILVSEQLRVEIDGIDRLDTDALLGQLTSVINTVQDSGLTIGGASMLQVVRNRGNQPMALFAFTLDAETVSADARKLAVADARRSAEQLAHETGVRLGPVTAVHEQRTGTNSSYHNPGLQMFQAAGVYNPNEPQSEFVTDALGAVPVRISVTLTFAIDTQ